MRVASTRSRQASIRVGQILTSFVAADQQSKTIQTWQPTKLISNSVLLIFLRQKGNTVFGPLLHYPIMERSKFSNVVSKFSYPKFKFFCVTNGFFMFVSALTVRSHSNKATTIARMSVIHSITIIWRIKFVVSSSQTFSKTTKKLSKWI